MENQCEVLKVAYCGIEGAFANIAAKKIFPAATLVSYSGFEEAYEAVENGECDKAVIPIENSFAGEVAQVTDLMFAGTLYIEDLYSLTVHQNLLGVQTASLEKIKTVVSHPQALDQCRKFIKTHGLKTITCVNTAVAAKQVAESNDESVAAIGSAETAPIYNLKILAENINENSLNTTKFAVFSRTHENHIASNCPGQEIATVFILMFVVKNEPGALVKVLNVISDYGYNMRVVRSRPLKQSPWEYFFYVEAEGGMHAADSSSDDFMKKLSDECEIVKVLGASVNHTQL